MEQGPNLMSGKASPFAIWTTVAAVLLAGVACVLFLTVCQQGKSPGEVQPIPVAPGEIPEEPAHADPYWQRRMEMVRDTIEAPPEWLDRPAVTDPKVLDAMRTVPRHEFVLDEARPLAYIDSALEIEHDQTISQPYMVALMTDLLQLERDHKVLEIGTGSGYQAAVLAELVDDVYSIEIVEPLGRSAARRLQRLGYTNVRTRIGDGHRGWPEEAPFDRIIVTCAPESVPPDLVEQLTVGGRLVIPVGPRWVGQELLVLVKETDGSLQRDEVMGVIFVEMTGGDEDS